MADVSFDFEADIDSKDALRQASLKAEGGTSESAATGGRHSIVCRHWLRALCMKGDKCDFLHQYDPNRMPECIYWLKFGKCSDPNCVYKHVAPSERPECQRYRLGFCRHGAMCRSRHDRMSRESLPEVLPDWFIDSVLLNSHLVPRSEEVNLAEFHGDRGKNGGSHGFNSELALAPLMPSTEQGTVPGLPPPIHAKCRYFNIRSMNVRNIQVSAAKGIWATSSGNTHRLRQAYRDVDHVILIFSATETRNFQGYGKMSCEPDDLLFPGIWGELSGRLSANFRVHWIKQCAVSLAHADHIKNPQNDDLPVRRCRDGQELPSSVGERLCRFLWQQTDTDLLKGTELKFEPPPMLGDLKMGVNERHGGPEEQKANTSVTLAIEDTKKDSDRQGDDERARPAPAPLGTFHREQMNGRMWGCGRAAVTVGKALASGSSSLLAAVAEDAQRHGQPPPVHWSPPLSWRPGQPDGNAGMPPGEWQHSAGYQHPPGYYQAAAWPTHNYGFNGPGGFAGLPEVRPPAFWAGPAPAPGPQLHFTQPPSSWEGASSGPVFAGDGRGRHRSRSRGKKNKQRRRR
mmetsp:Transcript_136451/g.272141  ORF Transcript_136451/g.272141 Transcript_136451/m.272141 type:complete len:571 (+) Transcript_136451:121-1833(+)